MFCLILIDVLVIMKENAVQPRARSGVIISFQFIAHQGEYYLKSLIVKWLIKIKHTYALINYVIKGVIGTIVTH